MIHLTPTTESVRAQIEALKARRAASTDADEREDLADAISAIALGWQFREILAEDE